MSLRSNITKRPGSAVYYARLMRPVELVNARAAAGLPLSKDVWRSLGTRDPKDAVRKGSIVLDRMRDEFDAELRALRSAPAKSGDPARKLHKPTQAEIETVAWEFVATDLSDYERLPSSDLQREFRDAERAAIGGAGFVIGNQVERPTAADMYGNVAEALIRQQAWDILPDSPEFLHLCNQLRGGRLVALKAMTARDEGDYLSPVAHPAPPAAIRIDADPLKRQAKRGETLLELLPVYMKEAGHQLSKEDQRKKAAVVRLFAEHVGLKRDIKTISSEDVRNFKLGLKHWPSNAHKYTDLKGKDFPTIVELSRKAKGRFAVISDKTLNNYIAQVGGYFGWLYSNGYASRPEITHGLSLKINKADSARDSHTADELQSIFALPTFTGSASLEDDRTPGDQRVADWRFWIPAICLYSGARLGEIAQLRAEDVRQVRGHWAFCIADGGEGQTIKNKTSIRNVPIHAELLRLGFLNFHKGATGNLFPELEPDEYDRLSGPVSKWWNSYMKRAGIASTLYQLRHSFMDALRGAGYMDAEFRPLVGHKEGTTTELYGNVPQVTMDRRAEMIASVAYPVKLTPPKQVHAV